MAIEATLSKLQSLLYGYNYAVFLHTYHVPVMRGASVEDYIVQAFPNAQVGGLQPVSAQEMLVDVEQSLRYAGDAGAGPKPTALNSSRFEHLLAAVLSYLQQRVAGATSITSFWLRRGHPAHPVFWDFAFVIVGSDQVEIFVGSSSD